MRVNNVKTCGIRVLHFYCQPRTDAFSKLVRISKDFYENKWNLDVKQFLMAS